MNAIGWILDDTGKGGGGYWGILWKRYWVILGDVGWISEGYGVILGDMEWILGDIAGVVDIFGVIWNHHWSMLASF